VGAKDNGFKGLARGYQKKGDNGKILKGRTDANNRVLEGFTGAYHFKGGETGTTCPRKKNHGTTKGEGKSFRIMQGKKNGSKGWKYRRDCGGGRDNIKRQRTRSRACVETWLGNNRGGTTRSALQKSSVAGLGGGKTGIVNRGEKEDC